MIILPALLALLAPIAASAQAYQCRMPRVTEAPYAERSGPVRRLAVTGYTLALSWSPEYCKSRETKRMDALQCSGRNGRFGFILHGLWPESGRSWPQWCPTRNHPTGIDIARQLCLTPSVRLVAHQWAKHGSCMAQRPATYFKVSQILWDSLRWPDYDRMSRKQGLTVGDIRKAFADANPDWPESAVGVHLGRGGWLKEIRLCYSRRFMPRRCDARRSGANNGAKAKIWRGI